MGLLDLFKKKAITVSSSEQVTSSEFTDNELAFLKYSAGHDTDVQTFSKQFFYHYDLDYSKTINKLLNAGLLTIGTAEESLNLYTVNDLRLFLKQNGLSTTGKKDALIERIITQTTDFHNFFTKRIYILTDLGRKFVDDYNHKMDERIQRIVSTTISSLHTGDLDSIYPLFESKKNPTTPIEIPYDKSSIQKDINAIKQYMQLNHETDRELAACVVSIMMHQGIKNSINTMKTLGYKDACESEIYTAISSITSLRNINEYQNLRIEKYKISSCNDDRVCDKCKKMNDKIFPLSKAQLGKTLPPFCDKCRCIVHPIFKFKE